MIIKAVNFIFLLALSTLYSCFLPDSGPKRYDIIEIKNETVFLISVDEFRKGKPTTNITNDKIIIEPKSSKIIFSESKRGFAPPLFDGRRVDSLIIFFGQQRRLLQYCNGAELATCPDIENSILFNRYKIEDVDGKVEKKRIREKRVFSITINDYERASVL